MSAGRKALVALAVVAAVALSIPAIAYGAGLMKIEGRPVPADPTKYAASELAAAWQRCRDQLPVSVVPLNPWGYTAKFLWGSPHFEGSGQLSAWHIVRIYNSKHLPEGMKWWHLSGASLTIWVTQNWSGDQIAATLIRDGLCGETPNTSFERTREG
jgi:hypothetical protein